MTQSARLIECPIHTLEAASLDLVTADFTTGVLQT